MNEVPVSIIIPTYNRALLLKRSVSSILDQTYQNYEIIIVDDGSTDDTEQVVHEIGDARVRYIKMPENKGAAAARNMGVHQSRYDLIAFQDSDDEWVYNKLEKQMAAINNAQKDVGLVFCSYECNNGMIVPPKEKKATLDNNIFEQLLYSNFIGTPTILMHKDCFCDVGGFNESLKCLEDWELVIRVAKEYKVLFLDEVLLKVNISSDDGVNANAKNMMTAEWYMLRYWQNDIIRLGYVDKWTNDIMYLAQCIGCEDLIKGKIENMFSN